MAGFVGLPPIERSGIWFDKETIREMIAELARLRASIEYLGGTPDWILSGTLNERPKAGFKNRLFVQLPEKKIWLDDGNEWREVV